MLDQQTAPGNDAAVVEIIVSHHFKLGFAAAVGVAVGDFLRLDMGVQLFLARYSRRTVTSAGRLARQKKSK